jgi:hypothetical protein
VLDAVRRGDRSPGVQAAFEPTLQRHVALVTGVSSGIGRATALAMARAGARVAVADWRRMTPYPALHGYG